MEIIITTGMPACGKGSINEYLVNKHAATQYTMSDFVRQAAHQIDPNMHVRDAAKLFRQEDLAYFAKMVSQKIHEDINNKTVAEDSIILIDGSRNLEEIDHFKEAFGNSICVVAIHSSPKVRHRRILKRNREDDIENTPLERDMKELSFGNGNLIAMADFVLTNETSIKDLYQQVDKILQLSS